MAGGKETPRQKMIGMMYLVLTALLALNVSKEVIAAFVTINDKLDRSAVIINEGNLSNYDSFEKKLTTAKSLKQDTKNVIFWQNKAETVSDSTKVLVDYLLRECNAMLKEAEKVEWYTDENVDGKGRLHSLKPLGDVQNMDNYDIPTNFFIGPDPKMPDPRGLAFPKRIISYRNSVAQILGTYTDPGDPKKKYSLTVPEDLKDLSLAMNACNPDDTAMIASFIRSLDIKENITRKVHGEEEVMPWPSVMFDHAPIVAAAAMITALKLDVKNAESIATGFMLSKVDIQEFNFNKIEPLAFASTGYINQGDSLNLRVMIAAYDSTEIPKVSWAQDADTANPSAWKPGGTADGSIALRGDKPGAHKIKGVIYIKQRGVDVPKPWSFDYQVGQPMGVVALPEMRVLYRGYKNIVEGTASGFPADRVSLSGSGCSLSKSGKNWVATVGSGVREATISVIGKKPGGGSANLGSFKFKVKKLPAPTVYLGGITNGQTPGLGSVKANANSRLTCRYDESVPLQGVSFKIVKGTVTVDGIMRKGKIGGGGSLNGDAKKILAQSKGKQVTMLVTYRGPDGVSQRGALVFTPR
ncbi:MAG: hypothetical protein AB8B72_03535 [Crocinitomicaceae bacterium]